MKDLRRSVLQINSKIGIGTTLRISESQIISFLLSADRVLHGHTVLDVTFSTGSSTDLMSPAFETFDQWLI
jgi:hypothetical protein